MTAVRCVIDAMVFDAIAYDAELLVEVDRLTSAGRLELLAASGTLDEVAATPDRLHRRRLQRVRVLALPPADLREPAAARLSAALHASPGVSEQDAQAAIAAAAHRVALVTEDRDLRAAAALHLADVPLWTWAQLRPRIAELAAELPPASRGAR